MAASGNDYKKLNINAYGQNLYFISYLTDSDISYEMKDQQLPFVPTSFNNDSMATRVMEKAKFTFDVFSKHRDECIENYNNLQTLLDLIKPSYSYDRGQWIPSPNNVNGFFKLKFLGMPLLDRDQITLHLTSFNYSINKDTGYLDVNKTNLKRTTNESKLIPISYKISIEGKILLPFNDTVRIVGAPAQPPIQNTGVSPSTQSNSSTSSGSNKPGTAKSKYSMNLSKEPSISKYVIFVKEVIKTEAQYRGAVTYVNTVVSAFKNANWFDANGDINYSGKGDVTSSNALLTTSNYLEKTYGIKFKVNLQSGAKP